mmetsp:Transcript_14142/g.35940  ORF Transcript_14142/g.35940 Transcript_14142/m.35940 type:complete len:206 (-) Transcript_14142:540-1157(-)
MAPATACARYALRAPASQSWRTRRIRRRSAWPRRCFRRYSPSPRAALREPPPHLKAPGGQCRFRGLGLGRHARNSARARVWEQARQVAQALACVVARVSSRRSARATAWSRWRAGTPPPACTRTSAKPSAWMHSPLRRGCAAPQTRPAAAMRPGARHGCSNWRVIPLPRYARLPLAARPCSLCSPRAHCWPPPHRVSVLSPCAVC